MRQKLIRAGIASMVLFGTAIPSMTPIYAATASQQTATIVSGVNMRTSASTSGSVIRMLKTGESVTIFSKVNSYWYQIKDKNGKTGYISTSDKYIRVTTASAPAPAPTPAPAPAPTVTSAKVIYGVNMRTKPSAGSSVIRMLSKGETVTVLSAESVGWYSIKDKNGKTGYISSSSKYTELTGKLPAQPAPTPTPAPAPAPKPEPVLSETQKTIERVIAAGKKYLGTPYEFGSSRSDTSTFDCSDFVRQAFLDGANLKLPGSSSTQADYVKQKNGVTSDLSKLKPGDLMFFMSYKGSKKSSYTGINKKTAKVTHVSIYLGDGKLLHTYSKESGGVRIDSFAGKHWEYRFVYGGSVLK